MMKLNGLALLVLTCLSGANAFAQMEADQVQKIVNVNGDNQTAEVAVVSSQGALTGMQINSAQSRAAYTLSQIVGGVTVYVKQGFKVLTLKGTVDARTQEGNFTMGYLTNALTGNYKSCDFILRRDSRGWYIENAYTHQKPIETINVIANSFGVDTLQGICP